MKVVDADTHVHESPAIWDFLDPAFRPRRPLVVTVDEDTCYGDFNAMWLIEGRLLPKGAGPGIFAFRTPPTSLAARKTWAPIPAQTLEDVPSRLADMDRMGIDYEIVFPTLFLAPIAEDMELERALCQAYNRFMAKACARSEGRIFFAATLPWRNVQDAVALAREAKDLGAVAAWVPGMMWDKPLGDPSLFPLYEELSRLEMPLCVHFAWGAPSLHRSFSTLVSQFFPAGVLPVIMGFESLMSSGVYERFPTLKVAIVEAGSEWLPWLVHQLDRRYEGAVSTLSPLKKRPSEYVKAGNIYITCEADEDIPYLLQYISEDCLLIGSDYPHLDPSHEKEMVQALNENERVPATVRKKMLSDNPLRFYNLPA